ncbi:PREDICTED: protein indeterminate-domain 2-like [Nelumbo nucifera]|uniref:Protein indeterminate-domain 2-like n=2 Tax=Nelumbo nucifera TaxID=4432 RepID=A0A1U8B0S7_NELNU|nr:PREDICTED: protein indeterminate-domain 2-like [Nelumbo nucifera]DAD41089.1 TPA_asm: hypothetical protein HUJ06_015412 [Nelumbo nucifera]
MSNVTGDCGSFSSGNTGEEVQQQQQQQLPLLQHHFRGSNFGPSTATNGKVSTSQKPQQQQTVKKKRNLPGTPDPSAEVIALSPATLMATNRFVCEICSKGFQRDQNLQLHRRGHNLPWKLRQRTSTEVRKRVYICPEPSCVHHNPGRALGDLTGIKKHFCRKHGEKKWKCDKCSKKYAVQSDWKAHSKTCGTREYKCDCGTIFSRRDSFITHRAFCDALTEENNKVNQQQGLASTTEEAKSQGQVTQLMSSMPINTINNSLVGISSEFNQPGDKNPLKSLPSGSDIMSSMPPKSLNMAAGSMFSSSSATLFGAPRSTPSSSFCFLGSSAHMSATALLQKAALIGAAAGSNTNSSMIHKSFIAGLVGTDHQLSSIRTSSYGGMHQNNNSSYDHTQLQADPSQPVGKDSGELTNQLLEKSKQDKSPKFFEATESARSSGMNGMGMLLGVVDQNHGFLKNIEHEHSSSTSTCSMSQGRSSVNSGVGIPPTRRNQIEMYRVGGSSSGDVMTVDFLGIGGSKSAALHEQGQQQQKQGSELEAISEQRLQGFHQFQQQQSHGQTTMVKSLWDV